MLLRNDMRLPSAMAEPPPLAGSDLAFVEALDNAIVTAALADRARAVQFGPLIAMETLDRAGYSQAFPHLVTVPAAMTTPCMCGHGAAGAGHALLPAACLPVYAMIANADFSEPALVTTRNTCWRLEDHFEPLRRQWAFTMREVVCVGASEEVRIFRARWRSRAARLAKGLGIDAAFTPASDPFFGAAAAQRLYQAVSEAKSELVAGQLAIASLNNHGTHFAAAFNLRRNGTNARSACVAFGLERWLAAMRDRHGPDSKTWPPAPDLTDDSETVDG